MKFTPTHYVELNESLNKGINEIGGIESLVIGYETGNFIRSEFVKDLNTRFRFDIFYVLKGWNRKLYDELNEVYDYGHIETVLKRILPTLTRKY